MSAPMFERAAKGPLIGVRVVEFAAMGPAPFCAMWLADMGADVLRIDRTGERPRGGSGEADVLQRGRRSVTLDLKNDEARTIARSLAVRADMVVEGFRPGVMERLGLGPREILGANPKSVYGRVTGWGQDGPLAQAAGHDLNYLALSGALFGIGAGDAPPVPPLNLVADFGGGGMLLALGMLGAYVESLTTGHGQVVDAAMAEGSALLMSMLYGYAAMGRWNGCERGVNFLDGSAYFYSTYRCADGRFIAVGAIEKQFHDRLLRGLALDPDDFREQWTPDRWPDYKQRVADRFATGSRDQWADHFESLDACVSPVLDMSEAPRHPHNLARGAFVDRDGVVQPSPAPRFSRSPDLSPGPIPLPGQHTAEILSELGISPADQQRLRDTGAI